jgi:hypothetical protein
VPCLHRGGEAIEFKSVRRKEEGKRKKIGEIIRDGY